MAVTCSLESAVSFEPVSSVTSVFFDDRNQQVFSVRSGGATGILVRGFDEDRNSTFRLEDRGPVISIKLSPDQRVLAVQRAKNAVEFVSVVCLGSNGYLEQGKSYAQSARRSDVLGLHWISETEIAFLTGLGIEVYAVADEKRSVRSVRHHSVAVQWHAFCPASGVLVTSPATRTSALQPFVLRPGGAVVKLPKIEAPIIEIREREVNVFALYGGAATFVSVICHSDAATVVHLYSVCKEAGTVARRHVLHTPFDAEAGGGGVALNVVDDLVVCHHQASGTSAVFDVATSGQSDGSISHHAPIGSPASVAQGFPANGGGYSPNWVTFAPDVVIDAKVGRMWRLTARLDLCSMTRLSGASATKDLPEIVGFLLQRQGAKMALLDVMLDWCSSPETKLHSVGTSFNLVNREYRNHLDFQIRNNLALPSSFYPSSSSIRSSQSCVDFSCRHRGDGDEDGDGEPLAKAKVVLDQSDLYTHLFSPLLELASGSGRRKVKRLISILLEYSRSLGERQIPVQHFLSELLINLLVQDESWYQLHQLLQYHVISDTKPLACLLLSLESVYPPAGQLALDMLARLRNSSDEICEVLLSKKRVLSAIRFVEENGGIVQARKFLDAALSMKDDVEMPEEEAERWKAERDAVFVSAYGYFRERNMLPLRGGDEYARIFRDIVDKANNVHNNSS